MKLLLFIPLIVITFYAVVAGLAIAFVWAIAEGIYNILADIYQDVQKKTS